MLFFPSFDRSILQLTVVCSRSSEFYIFTYFIPLKLTVLSIRQGLPNVLTIVGGRDRLRVGCCMLDSSTM